MALRRAGCLRAGFPAGISARQTRREWTIAIFDEILRALAILGLVMMAPPIRRTNKVIVILASSSG
jgi:hypothetical protein